MLLHWGTLEPHGASNLASVRFSGPVRIRAIRLYPNGTSLFAQRAEVISKTEPDAFVASVFVTAQPVPTAQDSKPKATNVLVPTRLSYSGGLREFPLDMGPDFVTRLMVIQGTFTRVTLSVHGDMISDPMDLPFSYEPAPLPHVTHHRLSSALDPCNAADPSFLSKELLMLIPGAPTVSLVIRLMCCFKIPSLSWDFPSFVYSDLKESLETDLLGVDWLTRATATLMAPVHPDVSSNLLKEFAEKLLEAISEKSNESLYLVAGLLRYASAQPPIVLITILDVLDLSDIIDTNFLDKDILDCLRDSAANPIMARALRTTPSIDILQTFRDAASTSRPLKDATTNLLQRVSGWEQFEKALITPTPDIAILGRWIKEIASDDMTFGTFLLSLVEDQSLSSKLSGHPAQEQGAQPITLWNSTGLASLTEFTTFMKAFIGVSCVIVVLCWSNYVANDSCTQRILAMIRLWQEVDGYREIANHILLIPRVIYHLQSILKISPSAPPSTGLILVEQFVACLCAHPETMSRPELRSLVNSLPDQPASITEDERLEMVEISVVAESGLLEAVATLLDWSSRSTDSASARILQTALLILENTLEDRETGEWKIMQASWQAGSHGLIYCLAEIFEDLVLLIRKQFLLTPPPPLRAPVLLHFLGSSNIILRILSRLLPAHPLPNRTTRNLTLNIASLFVATDTVDSRFSQGAVCQAARVTRPRCAEAIAVLSSIPDESNPGHVQGEQVLRTLLHLSLYPDGDDPVTRVEQVFWLLDLILPLSLSDSSGDRTEQRLWTRKIIPNVLPQLQRFMRALAVDHQIELVKRLADLDRGEVAVGQWFVDEELKYLIFAVNSLKIQPGSDMHSIAKVRVSNSFQFLSGLIKATSTGDTLQFFGETRMIEGVSRVLACLLDNPVTFISVLDFACLLAPHALVMDPPIHLELTLTLLRGARLRPSAFLHAKTLLHHIKSVKTTDIFRLADELGPTLQCIMDNGNWQSYWQHEEEHITEAILSILGWLVSQPKPETLLLSGISEESFCVMLERVTATALNHEKLISSIRPNFIFSDDVVMRPIEEEPVTPTLSTNRLNELLSIHPIPPSTPRLGGESIFKMATLSPLSALVGTSKLSSLTKTYQNNDFRHLSVRQNTSRRPSMHVDVGV